MTEAIAVSVALGVLYTLMAVATVILVLADKRSERREPPAS
jgi:hypothetical protein